MSTRMVKPFWNNFRQRTSSAKIWKDLKIKRWWPNGIGKQILYRLQVSLLDEAGTAVQVVTRQVGFKNIQWLPCLGAKAKLILICSINNQPLFCGGKLVAHPAKFCRFKERRLPDAPGKIQELGVNTIRVWGGGFRRKTGYTTCATKWGSWFGRIFR